MTETTFWQKFTIGFLVYTFIGAFLLGGSQAHMENKCGFIRKISAAAEILTWLPGVIGFDSETNDTVSICETKFQ